MHISTLEEYGLRCALQLAKLQKPSTLSASQIAEKEGLSMQYVSKIMFLFRRAGLVDGKRGIQGGFQLHKSAQDIPIKDIFDALRGAKVLEHFCSEHKGKQLHCVHLESCSVRPVWETLTGYFASVLEQVTLADLLLGENESRKRIDLFAKQEANRVLQRMKMNRTNSIQALSAANRL